MATRTHAMVLAACCLWALADRIHAAGGSDYVLQPVPLSVAAPPPGVRVPEFKFMFGAPARWPGAMHWRYNHANAPAAYSGNKAAAIQQITDASSKWAAACGAQFVYDGETTTPPNRILGGQPDGVSVVGWQTLDSATAALTYSWYETSGGARVITDSDILLSPVYVTSASEMARTVTHEWGHAIGVGHSNVANTLMSGLPDTPYSFLSDLTADDAHGCLCLYGPRSGQQAGYICSLPAIVDFGTQNVGALAGPNAVTVTNGGNAPLTIGSVRTGGGEFFVSSNSCAQGGSLGPGASCTFALAVRPAIAGTRTDEAVVDTSGGPYLIPLRADGVGIAQIAPPTVDVIEFYHAGLDHYFISSLQPDIVALDSGRFPGWTRTGRTFRAYPSTQPGASPVCRIYIPAAWGESHFFSASPQECAESMAKFPQFILESAAAMYVGLPDAVTGNCAPGWTPVYRVWNNRADSNHRYTTDRALRDAMVAKGYVAEGYGPDIVIMCAAP